MRLRLPICNVMTFFAGFGTLLGFSQIFLSGLSVFLANSVIWISHDSDMVFVIFGWFLRELLGIILVNSFYICLKPASVILNFYVTGKSFKKSHQNSSHQIYSTGNVIKSDSLLMLDDVWFYHLHFFFTRAANSNWLKRVQAVISKNKLFLSLAFILVSQR